MIAGQGFVTPRFYASLESIPLAIRHQLGQAQDLLGHPPRVVLGQALGEVPARRLVLEIDAGEDAASGVPDLERLALLLDLPRLGKRSTVP